MQPHGAATLDRTSVGAVLVLCAALLIECIPALRGDYLDYLDNPIHLAELRDLAKPASTGWSTQGFSGFPLDIIHSPLIFGSVAWLTRVGLPLEPLYTALSIAGLLAPSLAMWLIARARLGAVLALVPAILVLSFRGSLVGVSAALGGMFAFHFAAAAFIVVLDRLARPSRTLLAAGVIALLAGVIGLTHLFVCIALVYLALIHCAFSLVRGGEQRSRLVYDLPALALGAVMAAAYWLPNLLARTATGVEPIAASEVLKRLFSATVASRDAPGAVAKIMGDPLWHADALLQLVPFVLATFGAKALLRGRDDAPRYGALIALAIFGLTVVQAKLGVPVLGPQGLRLLYIAKLGVLLAALPGLHRLTARVADDARSLAWVGALVLVLALGANRVVAWKAVPHRGADMDEVRRVWSWLAENKQPDWGRIYIRNTAWRDSSPLGGSHVLALTAERTGIEQLGVYYNVPTYADRPWLIYELDESHPVLAQDTRRFMTIGNATHLLLHGRGFLEKIEGSHDFERLSTIGRFSIFALRDADARWATVTEGSGSAVAQRRAPGVIALSFTGDVKRALVNESFHPFFRAEPAGAAHISSDERGRIVVEPQLDEVVLRYASPRWPAYLSWCGALCAALLIAAGWRGARARERHLP